MSGSRLARWLRAYGLTFAAVSVGYSALLHHAEVDPHLFLAAIALLVAGVADFYVATTGERGG